DRRTSIVMHRSNDMGPLYPLGRPAAA
ncbi:unnamed protein product, partial [Cuscuta campestris]